MSAVAPSEVASTVISVQNASNQSNMNEAVEVLVSLGFSQSEATLAVSKLDSSLSVDELIRKGLKNLSSNL